MPVPSRVPPAPMPPRSDDAWPGRRLPTECECAVARQDFFDRGYAQGRSLSRASALAWVLVGVVLGVSAALLAGVAS